MRGILPSQERNVSVIASKMVQGRLDDLKPGSFNIVLGRELATWMGVSQGDDVVMITSEALSTRWARCPR